MTTLLAFLLTIGILIAVHEYGHYRVAVACGVKVLRFSLGFGPVVYRRQGKETEFVISALPLGGYVRMLGDRDPDNVPTAAEAHRAFSNKTVLQRAAIVLAGPLANLLLAMVLYAGLNWYGVEELKPVLAEPVPGSLVDRAGLQSGDWVRSASTDAEDRTDVRSLTDLRWQVMQAALDKRVLQLEVTQADGSGRRLVSIDFAASPQEVDTDLLQRIGFDGPYRGEAVIGQPVEGGPASRAGLKAGDRIRTIDGVRVEDAAAATRMIRASLQGTSARSLVLGVERAGQTFDVRVQPIVTAVGNQQLARIEVPLGEAPARVTVSYGVLDGLAQGVRQTWEMSKVTLTMLGRILIGEASLRNLSGPLTIADYAGRTASLGLSYYIGFLAVVSVSLGVLNLLPLPMLDGGHLMYYLFEGLTGRPIPDAWLDRLQRGGLAIMLLMMSLALYNDLARMLGQS